MALHIIETTLDKYNKLVEDNKTENNAMYLCPSDSGNFIFVRGVCYGGYDDTDVLTKIQELEKTLEENKDKSFIHKQNSASSEWIIKHNLEKYPAISIVDSAGSSVYGEITYIDSNTASVKFTGAFSGIAYCN